MTTGLMEWGQGGSYNAPDDRRALTAMAAGRSPGVVNPVVLTAGSGLNINVAAGWLAVVDCGDGTFGVAGTAAAAVVLANAGDPGSSRTDSLWCDISPTSGTYSLVVIPQTAETGRIGTRLATLTVPANANLASAFTMTPRVASFANFPNGLTLGPTGALWTLTPESPAGYLKLQQGTNRPMFLQNNGNLVPAQFGTTTPEVWHAMTPLLNGWALTSAGVGHFKATLDGECEVVAYLNGGAATSPNIFSMPSGGYRPAVQQSLMCNATAGVIGGQAPYVTVTPGGTFALGGATAGTTGMSIAILGKYPIGTVP